MSGSAAVLWATEIRVNVALEANDCQRGNMEEQRRWSAHNNVCEVVARRALLRNARSYRRPHAGRAIGNNLMIETTTC